MMPSGRLVEAAWPYLGAALSCAVWYWVLRAPFPTPAASLLGAALTATAVIVGFLATAKAVMLGVAGSETFKRLRDAGFVGSLFRYLYEAVWFGIVFLVYSVLGFFIDQPATPIAFWYPPVWVLIGSLVVMLYARITRLFFMLLNQV